MPLPTIGAALWNYPQFCRGLTTFGFCGGFYRTLSYGSGAVFSVASVFVFIGAFIAIEYWSVVLFGRVVYGDGLVTHYYAPKRHLLGDN